MSILPGSAGAGLANRPPAPAATVGQPIPETDPAYLLFAAGQGYRESEARFYTALRQNAIHQAFQDQLPGMILAGQKQAQATTKQWADAGAWRTGGRMQAQQQDQADQQAKITAANNAQQQQQDDLAAQLTDHIANLRMDTSQAALQARENSALSTAALGQQAYVNGKTMTAQVPSILQGPNPYLPVGYSPSNPQPTPGPTPPPNPYVAPSPYQSPDTSPINGSGSGSTPGNDGTPLTQIRGPQ